MSDLDFVIIGAQKSASTYLQTQLSLHKNIYLPKGEYAFFEDLNLCETRSSLDDLFLQSEEGKKLGIKRPNYLAKPDVAKKLLEYSSNLKLIAVLRDPVRRACSAYFHYIKYGFIRPLPITQGMDLILAGSHPDPAAKDILEYSCYGKQLQMYLKLFPKDQLHVVFQEILFNSPLDQLNQVFNFLDVSKITQVADVGRPQSVVYNLNRLRWIRCGNRFVYSYNQNKTRLKMNKGMHSVSRFFLGVDHFLLSRIFTKSDMHLSTETKNTLQDFFESDKNLLRDAVDSAKLPYWLI